AIANVSNGMVAIVHIDAMISSERYNLLKQQFALLHDVPIDRVRYWELEGSYFLLRIIDERYCRQTRCLTIVSNSNISGYVLIQSNNVAFLIPQTVSLGAGNDGSMITFQTDDTKKEIKVFVNDKFAVVLE